MSCFGWGKGKVEHYLLSLDSNKRKGRKGEREGEKFFSHSLNSLPPKSGRKGREWFAIEFPCYQGEVLNSFLTIEEKNDTWTEFKCCQWSEKVYLL